MSVQPANPDAKDATQQQDSLPLNTVAQEPTALPNGRRAPFQHIKRQLTDAEMANTGTQKLILEMLDMAEAERDEFKLYVPKFYKADRRAAILEEKLDRNTVNEITFAVLLAGGSAIIGLAPTFWNSPSGQMQVQGPICLVIGAIFVAGGALSRIGFIKKLGSSKDHDRS